MTQSVISNSTGVASPPIVSPTQNTSEAFSPLPTTTDVVTCALWQMPDGSWQADCEDLGITAIGQTEGEALRAVSHALALRSAGQAQQVQVIGVPMDSDYYRRLSARLDEALSKSTRG